MSKTREEIIKEVVLIEGGYSDNPDDTGGRTRYGITEAVARKHGYKGQMRDLPKDMAIDIYRIDYWDPIRGDDLLEADESIAFEVFDTGVNCGTGTAARLLQRALNVLNRKQALYFDIVVDGGIGPVTIATLNQYLANRDAKELWKTLNCLQGARYVELCERREANETHFYGWIKKRVNT
jgi:lysozyme family protein